MEQNAAYEGQQIYHPKGWWGLYVFSQDHKIIALQYTCVALAIGLTGMFLSLMMRMQLGFPGLFDSIDAGSYYQDVTMHGMIMVIYLLTALFLGGFGNYLIPLMLGSRDMAFPFVNMLSFWVYFLSVIILVSSFFCSQRTNRGRLDIVPPTVDPGRNAWRGWRRNIADVDFLGCLYCRFHHGWVELHHHSAAIKSPGHENDAHASDHLVYFPGNLFGSFGVSSTLRGCNYADL